MAGSRLIFAPHADDEVMGCGGVLAKYPNDCCVVVVAAPTVIREIEFEEARRVLGYRDREVLRMPENRLGDDMAALVTAFDWVLNRYRPETVYVPFPSMHQDHVAVYEGALRACRLSMTPEHWFPPRVLVYDVAAYDVALYPTDLRWNVFESLTDEQVDLKVEAMNAYVSEMVDGAHPVNGVKSLAHAIGSARKVEFAEQFALVRDVR